MVLLPAPFVPTIKLVCASVKSISVNLSPVESRLRHLICLNKIIISWWNYKVVLSDDHISVIISVTHLYCKLFINFYY